MVWGVERFHFYLFGREFELITDHKPLEVIFGPRSKPCAQIERWVLSLQLYKYKIVYKPGKSNIADSLSRLSVNCQDITNCKPFDENAEHYIHQIAIHAAPTALQITMIKECEIQAVRKGLFDNNWIEESKPYKIFETELCFAGDILCEERV